MEGFEVNDGKVNFIVKKKDLLVKPIEARIVGFVTNQFGKKSLVLHGTYEGRSGEHELAVNGSDCAMLQQVFKQDWSGLDTEKHYKLTAVDSGHEFNGYSILNLKIE